MACRPKRMARKFAEIEAWVARVDGALELLHPCFSDIQKATNPIAKSWRKTKLALLDFDDALTDLGDMLRKKARVEPISPGSEFLLEWDMTTWPLPWVPPVPSAAPAPPESTGEGRKNGAQPTSSIDDVEDFPISA